MSFDDVIEHYEKLIRLNEFLIRTNDPYNFNQPRWKQEIKEYRQRIEELKERKSKCKWIKYDYRTICPKECGGENPYWRIPENLSNLKYCPYCGKEIEVEE